jgi:hypothetical protein
MRPTRDGGGDDGGNDDDFIKTELYNQKIKITRRLSDPYSNSKLLHTRGTR